jgi:hypothetical protein
MTAAAATLPENRTGVRVTLPLRTISENNAREHHMARARRRKAQRDMTALVLRGHIRAASLAPPYLVTLTRLAPRKLDGDNLQGALKAVRDGVADALGVDDGDEQAVTWDYAQRPATGHVLLRGQGVEVRIEAA